MDIGVENPQQPRTARSKKIFFRVDDIPMDDFKDLDRNLRSAFEQVPALQDAAGTLVRHSLAAYHKDLLCATFSMTTSLSTDDVQSRLKSMDDYDYCYTCKFNGITPLHDAGKDARVDIIAVPGLGSHPVGSWKSSNRHKVWLSDFLPRDLPNIRVLLYGYDSSLPGSKSKQSITDLGSALLERIIAFRARDKTSHRPIIFIGHSLGGLLIKEALLRARNRPSDTNRDLSNASFGLIFFGVPNLGLRNDQLRTLVKGQPNEAFISDLLVDNDSEPSNFLRRLAGQFSETCKGQYRVVTFFERELSPTIKIDEDGKWSKSGDLALLVTEQSATSTGLVAVADEDNVPLNRNHSDLVKYDSRSDADYTIIGERITRLVEEAETEVARRFAEQSLNCSSSDSTKACQRSLAFHDLEGRQYQINSANPGTCSWFLKHEKLVLWTRQRRGLLWIKGKPGSGKSTLLKYALREVPPLYGSDALVLSFFFHGRGHELQRSPLGLFRSLLHQLLGQLPGALPDLVKYFEEKQNTISTHGEKWEWELQPLQSFLKSSILEVLKRFPVILFIDALDECGEKPAVKLIEYFKDLLSSSFPTAARFGICFSCRHYPILELGVGLTISLENENTADITTYVRSRLSGSHAGALLQRAISIRAQGVFMWAHLVVESVLQMERQGKSQIAIAAEIEQIPQDLNDLYDGLMLQRTKEDRSNALRLMEWICFSTRPFTIDELQWAMAVHPDCLHKTLDECKRSVDFITDDNIDRRIKTLSCGLVEIVWPTENGIAQFIHQSVKDYFVERGLFLLNDTITTANLVGSFAHCHLAWSCVQYLTMAARSEKSMSGSYSFFLYASNSWASHAKLGEPSEERAYDFLCLLQSPMQPFGQENKTLMRQMIDRIPDGNNLVRILSKYGLIKLLSCLLTSINISWATVNARNELGQTPLLCAVNGYQEAVVKILLDTGKADLYARDNVGQTPLLCAIYRGNKAIAKMLLDTGKVDTSEITDFGKSALELAIGVQNGAMFKMLLSTGKFDLDQRDESNHSLIWNAVHAGDKAVVKILLDTGKVDVNEKDDSDQSLLELAILMRHEAIVKMLLDTGKFDLNKTDEKGQTALHFAAGNGTAAVAELLVDPGLDIMNMRNVEGQTALFLATMNGDLEMMRLLIDKGSDVNIPDCYQQTLLEWAVMDGFEKAVELLVQSGVDVNRQDDQGRAALQLAAYDGYDDMVLALVEYGADVNLEDWYGQTALQWASLNGHLSIVNLLVVTNGAHVDARDAFGQTALHLAASNGHAAIARLLAENWADIDTQDNKQRTALHWAAKNGHEAVVRLLLALMADSSMRDKEGQTALDLAINGRRTVGFLRGGKSDRQPMLEIGTTRQHRAVVKLLTKGSI